MTAVYPLVAMISRLSVLTQALSTWQTCAQKLIHDNQPAFVSFICKTKIHSPANSLYKKLNMPSQTMFGLATHELPVFQNDDLVFIIDNRIISWDNKTAEKYRRGGRNYFKLVIVANMSDKLDDDIASMNELFAALWFSGIVRSAVLLANGTTSHLYTYLPFKNGSKCEDTSPVLIGKCYSGTEKVFDVTYKVRYRI